jgi:hypothetical protein
MQTRIRITIKALLTFVLFLVLLTDTKGQEGTAQKKTWWKGLVIETEGYAGKQIKIYPDYPKNNVSGYYAINTAFKCYGNKPWHSQWRYPQIGVEFLYGYLGNPDVLGSNFSLVPNITIESRDNRKLIADVKIGTGLAWFNKPYDRLKNPDNLIIGSHITDITHLSVNLRKPLGKYFAITGGFSFIHCSNGHYQLPNVGMNTWAFNVGLKYYPFRKPEIIKDTIAKPKIDRRVMVNIRIGFGVHEFGSATKPMGGPKYPIYMLNIFASKRVGKISNLHAGIFLNYYSGFYDYIVNQDFYSKNRRLNSFVLSVFIGHEFIIGRFGLVWQSGINVFNPFQREYFKMTYGTGTTAKMKAWWCNKIGAQFYLMKPENQKRLNIWIGAYIKSNLMTADFVETAVGIRF